MPPPPILDPATLDLSQVAADRDAIMSAIPHRFEFQLLDAVVLVDKEQRLFAGYHDIRPDAWWCRGHIPGRPLFPGVLMLESAAQLCSFVNTQYFPDGNFVAFSGIEGVKFRGTVEPPSRFLICGFAKTIRARRFTCQTQGFVDNRLVFEAEISGMRLGGESSGD